MTGKYRGLIPLLSLLAFSLSSPKALAIELSESAPNATEIQVVPVETTPEPRHVELRLEYPSDQKVLHKQPIQLQMRLDGFPLGVDSDFPRKNEIYNDSQGQSIHIFIDNRPYFEIDEALWDANDDHEEYYDQTVELDIPFQLEPGKHIIRAFPCRSYGESIKGPEGMRHPQSFIASTFYYHTQKDGFGASLTAPFITYNEPQGTYQDPKKPILLDFFVSNCVLSKDGYKVRLTIDGENKRFLVQWQPYYIYGLSQGDHKIRLELIDPQNKLVPGPFNDIERTIHID